MADDVANAPTRLTRDRALELLVARILKNAERIIPHIMVIVEAENEQGASLGVPLGQA